MVGGVGGGATRLARVAHANAGYLLPTVRAGPGEVAAGGSWPERSSSSMPPPSGLRSRRSLGNKRRDVPPARAADILPLLGDYAHGRPARCRRTTRTRRLLEFAPWADGARLGRSRLRSRDRSGRCRRWKPACSSGHFGRRWTPIYQGDRNSPISTHLAGVAPRRSRPRCRLPRRTRPIHSD